MVLLVVLLAQGGFLADGYAKSGSNWEAFTQYTEAFSEKIAKLLAAIQGVKELGLLYGSDFEKINTGIVKTIVDKVKASGPAALKGVTAANVTPIAIVSPKAPRSGDEKTSNPILQPLQYVNLILSHLSWPPPDLDFDFKAAYENNILPFAVSNGGRIIGAKLAVNSTAAKKYYVFVPVFYAFKNADQMHFVLRADDTAKPKKTGGQYKTIIGTGLGQLKSVAINSSDLPVAELQFLISDPVQLPLYNYSTYHVFLIANKLLSTVQENEAFELDWIYGYTFGLVLYRIDI
ncbi:MAG: hypothetical protein HYV03_08810 [Deltaproteobacteria bacterium]|nr:hypothetical protein [Deltaproteobacteria bacterium]